MKSDAMKDEKLLSLRNPLCCFFIAELLWAEKSPPAEPHTHQNYINPYLTSKLSIVCLYNQFLVFTTGYMNILNINTDRGILLLPLSPVQYKHIRPTYLITGL